MGRSNSDTKWIKKVDPVTGEERTIVLHSDHAKPTTRREFLQTGIIGFTGMMITPSIINVLANPENALAAGDVGCAAAGGSSMPAFFTVHLAGGGGIANNLPPLDIGRQPLSRYDTLGLGSNDAVFTDPNLGHELFPGVRIPGTREQGTAGMAGRFWTGMYLRTSQATLDRSNLVNICIRMNGDSTHSIEASGLVAASGLSGDLLPKIVLGSRNYNESIITSVAPLIASNYASIESALRPAGVLASRFSPARRQKLLEFISGLSGSQARRIASAGSASGAIMQKLVECATGKNVEITSNNDPGIDPLLNSGVAGVWGINAGNRGQAVYAQAAIAYNVLRGNATCGTIGLGGQDYHTGTINAGNKANQTNLDQQSGELVGRILETARIIGRKVVINVVSNGGGHSAPRGSDYGSQLTNDSSSIGSSILLFFDPSRRPAIKEDRFGYQVGNYQVNGNGSQSANTNTVSGTELKTSAVVLANYLAFAGQMQKFETLAPGVFTRPEMDEVVRIVG